MEFSFEDIHTGTDFNELKAFFLVKNVFKEMIMSFILQKGCIMLLVKIVCAKGADNTRVQEYYKVHTITVKHMRNKSHTKLHCCKYQ